MSEPAEPRPESGGRAGKGAPRRPEASETPSLGDDGQARPEPVEIGALLASGDLAVALIVVQRGLVKPAALDGHVEAFVARGAARGSASLLSHLVDRGVVSQGDVPAIKQARAAMGCACAACGEVTYLLPGQTHDATPCERCKKGPLGLPGAQPARRSAVQPALRPSSGPQPALPAAAPGPALAAVGSPVESVPPPGSPSAEDERSRKVLLGVGAILFVCFVAPCLAFALAPPPDWSEFIADPKGGKYKAEISRIVAVRPEGFVAVLAGRGQSDNLGGPRRQLEPGELAIEQTREEFMKAAERRLALVPYRLLYTNGAEIERHLATIERDRQTMRLGPLETIEVAQLCRSDGGEPALPWLFEVIGRGEVPPPRKVVLRVVVARQGELVGFPRITELALDEE